MDNLNTLIIPKQNLLVRRRKYDATTRLIIYMSFYELDEVSDKIWLLCNGENTIKTIIKTISKDVDLSLEEAFVGVVSILEYFKSKSLIKYN